VDRVLAVAARAAAGQWVPAVDEEERLLVRIKPPPDNPGEWPRGDLRPLAGEPQARHVAVRLSGREAGHLPDDRWRTSCVGDRGSIPHCRRAVVATVPRPCLADNALPADGHGGPIRRLLFLKSDDALLSSSDDCKARAGSRRSERDAEPLLTIVVAICPTLLSRCPDLIYPPQVKLWDIAAGPNGRLTRVFHGHSGAINDIAVRCVTANKER
jgi:WD40 repeat protein